MKFFIIVFVAVMLVSCSARKVYLGTVTDFTLSGGFMSRPTATIIIDGGKKVSCVLYKEIAVGDSVWDGDVGIVWFRPAKR